MYETFYRASQYLGLPLATAVFFAAFFIGVLLWVLNPRARADWERSAAMPLDDGAQPASPNTTQAQEP